MSSPIFYQLSNIHHPTTTPIPPLSETRLTSSMKTAICCLWGSSGEGREALTTPESSSTGSTGERNFGEANRKLSTNSCGREEEYERGVLSYG